MSFSYHIKFDRLRCVLVTFYERGHFVMLIIKSMHPLTCISGGYLGQKASVTATKKSQSLYLQVKRGAAERPRSI